CQTLSEERYLFGVGVPVVGGEAALSVSVVSEAGVGTCGGVGAVTHAAADDCSSGLLDCVGVRFVRFLEFSAGVRGETQRGFELLGSFRVAEDSEDVDEFVVFVVDDFCVSPGFVEEYACSAAVWFHIRFVWWSV